MFLIYMGFIFNILIIYMGLCFLVPSGIHTYKFDLHVLGIHGLHTLYILHIWASASLCLRAYTFIQLIYMQFYTYGPHS